MIEIRPIRPDEAAAAKRVIYRVALVIFNDTRPLEESIAYHEARGELRDLDDIQGSYFDNGGVFLVMTDDDEIICTGALRKLEEGVGEIKRLWLLTEYHGKGLGYLMIRELLAIAREMKYERIRLETDPIVQKPALDFYKRLGFYEIPGYSDRTDEIAMELLLK
jgi:putative acetyltransferase